MRAWEIRNGVLSLHDVEPPYAEEGEAVVCVSHIGICGSDLPKLLHPSGFALPEPWRPGHEIVGTDGSGRAVAVDPLILCGTCPRCTEGETHLCTDLRRLGWDLPGGFAEQVVIPIGNSHLVPSGLDPLHATLADPAAVAIHGLRCNLVGSPGRLAVIGAGAVGLLTALYAHQQGWEVTVVYRNRRVPHEAVTEAVPADFHSSADLSANGIFDVVVDAATGADSAPLDVALRLVRDGGAIVVQNAYHPGVYLPTPLRDVFRQSVSLIGSFSFCRRQRRGDFTLALDLLRDHARQIATLVADAGELADLPAVLGGRPTGTIRQVLAVQRYQRDIAVTVS